eukprot:gene8877-biopygen12167
MAFSSESDGVGIWIILQQIASLGLGVFPEQSPLAAAPRNCDSIDIVTASCTAVLPKQNPASEIQFALHFVADLRD